jgi:hypothetical protein
MLEPFRRIVLKDCRNYEPALAEVKWLERKLAGERIDDRWWKEPWLNRAVRKQAEDRHWRWRKLVGLFQSQWWVQRHAVVTPDEECQGAIIFDPNRESVLEPGEGAVYVEYLATAPRNRKRLAPAPVYADVGTWLLRVAMQHSVNVGFEGRLILTPLPGAVEFYTRRQNFQTTNARRGNTILLELTPEAARASLEESYERLRESSA